MFHPKGLYRGALCSNCNLKHAVEDKFIPIYFHNVNYDKNFFLEELAKYKNDKLSVLPLNKEKYISFSQFMKVKVDGDDGDDGEKVLTAELRFLDTFRFLGSSLDVLVKTLDKENLHHLKKHFPAQEDYELLSEKGFFPYSWLDCEEKFEVTTFPPKEAFFNDLSEENISDEDYNKAKRVFDHFHCENMGSYSDVYLVTDLLLLTDVYEQFRELAMSNYNLEVCKYFSIASYSWDAMLLITKVELELMTCAEQVEFIQKGIRGGITVVNQRYRKANNRDMKDFNPNLPECDLRMYDANSLYPSCMVMNIPTKDFEFVSPSNLKSEYDMAMKATDDSSKGWIFEVTLSVPKEKHNFFNDYPLCAENKIPPGGKFKKLILDLERKTNYVIHYANLKQALSLGMRLEKVHRILKFTQSTWLKTYVELNTNLRIKATSKFAKDFFKLVLNSVYGKSFENVLKHRNIKLVTRWAPEGKKLCAQTLIAKPNFHSISQFSDEFAAIEMKPLEIKLNRPIYIGFVVLEYSKYVMADFFYNYLRVKFADHAISLEYTDTDCFLIKVESANFYDMIRGDIAKYFDTSEMDESILQKYNLPSMNHKVLGMFKCETAGFPIIQFVALKAKCYAVEIEGHEKNYIKARCKGIAKAKIRKFDVNSYLNVLKTKKSMTTTMKRITSKLLKVKTVQETKTSLSVGDDKRFSIPNSFSTLAWGHKDIPNYSN